MSATKLRPREASSSARRRRRRGQQPKPHGGAEFVGDSALAPAAPVSLSPVAGDVLAPSRSPDSSAPETWWESLRRAERARAGRLRPMWQMTPRQRIAAMRRGQLTYEQLAAWSSRRPEQVPLLNGEFEWIAARMPEVCE